MSVNIAIQETHFRTRSPQTSKHFSQRLNGTASNSGLLCHSYQPAGNRFGTFQNCWPASQSLSTRVRTEIGTHFMRERGSLSLSPPCWHAGGLGEALLCTEKKRVNHVCMGLPTCLEVGDRGRKCRDLWCWLFWPHQHPCPTPTLLHHGVDQQQTEGESIMDVGGYKTQLRQTDIRPTYTNASHPSFPNTTTQTIWWFKCGLWRWWERKTFSCWKEDFCWTFRDFLMYPAAATSLALNPTSTWQNPWPQNDFFPPLCWKETWKLQELVTPKK